MSSLLQVNGLTKIFHTKKLFRQAHSFVAVNNISFTVNEGEIVGILGPNGAGKSTTMQMLLGTLTPTSGTITYFGKNLERHHMQVMEQVGYATGYSRFPSQLTVRENLRIVGALYGLSEEKTDERIEQLLEAFHVGWLADKMVRGLSAGQMTRIMLAKAFLASPKIVLLDEPTASLDPDVVEIIRHFLIEQKEKYKTAMLLASHDMDEVAHVCDRVLILKNGSIIATDTPEQLAATVSTSVLKFTVTSGKRELIALLDAQHMKFKINENAVAIELDEKELSLFLQKCAQHSILYSHIVLEKPTLEDYFLNIARSK